MKKYMIIFLLISIGKLYCQWEFIGLDSMMVRQVYVFGDTIWAGTASFDKLQKVGLYRSTNNGRDWLQIDSALGIGDITSLNFHPHNHNIIHLVKGPGSYTIGGYYYKSVDGGKTWNKINISDYGIKWLNISPFDYNKIYAVDGINNEVYKSVDGGNSWDLISSSFPVLSHGRFVAFNFSLVKDSVLFALVDVQFYQAFYKSTNDGYSWQYVSQPPGVTPEILTDNELDCRIYLQSYFITDDCGLNWTKTDSVDFTTRSYYLSLYIDTSSSKLYMMKTTGIYVSDKQKINWKKLSGSENLPLHGGSRPGFQSDDVGRLKNIFLIDSRTMYVGTNSGIYKKGNITSIDDKQISDNKNYFLYQNYPNPFNPITRIKYTIPQLSFVTIKIYDLLGREITTLVNKEQSAGNYEIEFNANNLSSGIYIYSIRTENFVDNKKMTLIK